MSPRSQTAHAVLAAAILAVCGSSTAALHRIAQSPRGGGPESLHPTAQSPRGGGPGSLHPTAQSPRGGGPASGRAVSLSASDGTTIAAMFYEPSNRPSAGVVLVHMLGRSKDEWTAIAERLQQAGATVLAIDLRGHGASSGTNATLPPMANDVRAAVDWLASRPGVRPGAVAIVGASLGATLAALVASETPVVRAVALISPSLEYRGLRVDVGVMKRLGNRRVWLAASTEDPYALRTIKELVREGSEREQRLTPQRGHGTALLLADPDLAASLVDWLRRALIF